LDVWQRWTAKAVLFRGRECTFLSNTTILGEGEGSLQRKKESRKGKCDGQKGRKEIFTPRLSAEEPKKRDLNKPGKSRRCRRPEEGVPAATRETPLLILSGEGKEREKKTEQHF